MMMYTTATSALNANTLTGVNNNPVSLSSNSPASFFDAPCELRVWKCKRICFGSRHSAIRTGDSIEQLAALEADPVFDRGELLFVVLKATKYSPSWAKQNYP